MKWTAEANYSMQLNQSKIKDTPVLAIAAVWDIFIDDAAEACEWKFVFIFIYICSSNI